MLPKFQQMPLMDSRQKAGSLSFPEGQGQQNSAGAGALGSASKDEEALMSRMDGLEAQEEAAASAAGREPITSPKEAAELVVSKQESSEQHQQGRKKAGGSPLPLLWCIAFAPQDSHLEMPQTQSLIEGKVTKSMQIERCHAKCPEHSDK